MQYSLEEKFFCNKTFILWMLFLFFLTYSSFSQFHLCVCESFGKLISFYSLTTNHKNTMLSIHLAGEAWESCAKTFKRRILVGIIGWIGFSEEFFLPMDLLYSTKVTLNDVSSYSFECLDSCLKKST